MMTGAMVTTIFKQIFKLIWIPMSDNDDDDLKALEILKRSEALETYERVLIDVPND